MLLTTTVIIFFGMILKAQTKNDSLAIEKACRDYVEGWATGDMDRVAKGVSPELVKLTVGKDKEGSVLYQQYECLPSVIGH